MLLYNAQTTVAQRCNPNMYCDHEVKKVPGGEALFIVMTFIECFWVPYLLIEYALQDIFMIYLCTLYIYHWWTVGKIITLTIKLLLHPYNWSYFLLTERTENWVQSQASQTQYVSAHMLKLIHLLILHNVAFYRV